MKSVIEIVPIKTDVLVIGGGLAGCMAGIKAVEHGVDVVVAEKSNSICSGQAGSGIDHIMAYIPFIHGKMGWTIEDLVEDHIQGVGFGFARRDLLHFIARESYNRILDLESFGVKMRYVDSKLPGNYRLVHQFHSVPTAINFDGYLLKKILTKEAKKRGVKMINRVMMTDLISSQGEIAGALGVGTRDHKIYSFQAKSVIMCGGGKIGRLGREKTGIDFNLHLPPNLTGDGKSMALKAGLEIMNMEFLSGRFGVANYDISGGAPRNTWQPATAVVDAKGRDIVPRAFFYEWGDLEKGYEIDVKETRRKWLTGSDQRKVKMPSLREWQETGPFFLDCTRGTKEEVEYIEWSLSNEGKCHQFLKHLKDENVDLRKDKIEMGPLGREIGNLSGAGLWVDHHFETKIKGLFAAGDEVGGIPFSASNGAFTMGSHCGHIAAKRATEINQYLPFDRKKQKYLQHLCSGILMNRDGHYWKEFEYTLQNIMDTYCGDIRSEEMLKRGIDLINEIKDVPLTGTNAHELSRCLEVRSLINNAEMVIRASLARRESRKRPLNFFRSDYPNQDDKNWFAFSTIKLENEKFVTSKIPIKSSD